MGALRRPPSRYALPVPPETDRCCNSGPSKPRGGRSSGPAPVREESRRFATRRLRPLRLPASPLFRAPGTGRSTDCGKPHENAGISTRPFRDAPPESLGGEKRGAANRPPFVYARAVAAWLLPYRGSRTAMICAMPEVPPFGYKVSQLYPFVISAASISMTAK